MTTAHRKSLLLFFLLGIFALCSSAFYIYFSYQDAQHQIKTRLENDSFLISEWIKGGFKSSDYLLRDVISQVDISELQYPNPKPEQHQARKAFLQAKLATLPNGILMGLFDSRCIVTHSNSVDGFDASSRDYCQAMLTEPNRKTVVSQAYTANNGQLNITQGRKFDAEQPGFKGMAALAINPVFFADLLAPLNYSPAGNITIFDSNMTLLARKPATPDKVGKKITQPFAEAFTQTDQSHTFLDINSPVDGLQRLFILRNVEGLPFLIVIGEAHQDWQANWRQRTFIIIIALILILLLAAFALSNYWSVLRHMKELEQLKSEAEHLARIDMLTGVSNRRDFTEKAETSFALFQRHKHPLSIIMLDADYFKQINDNYGHDIGDKVLTMIGDILKNTLRTSDIIGRIGGEEFAAVLPETDIKQAQQLAERLRQALDNQKVAINHNPDQNAVHCTASFGVAQANEKDTLHSLLKRADEGLYQAKAMGRNRVVLVDRTADKVIDGVLDGIEDNVVNTNKTKKGTI